MYPEISLQTLDVSDERDVLRRRCITRGVCVCTIQAIQVLLNMFKALLNTYILTNLLFQPAPDMKQDPHCCWFFTGVTAFVLQSTDFGREALLTL